MTDETPCSQCGGVDLDRFFVKDHGVNHVICNGCSQEWIE